MLVVLIVLVLVVLVVENEGRDNIDSGATVDRSTSNYEALVIQKHGASTYIGECG